MAPKLGLYLEGVALSPWVAHRPTGAQVNASLSFGCGPYGGKMLPYGSARVDARWRQG